RPSGATAAWEARFLRPSLARAASALAVLAFLAGALAIGCRLADQHPLAIFAEMYVDALRGVPMLVVVLSVGCPLQGALRDRWCGVFVMDRRTCGLLGPAMCYAAYSAGTFRAGIDAVPTA